LVRKKFDAIDYAMVWLSKYAKAYLTGTGSCIFAAFDTEYLAYDVFKMTPKAWQSFIARGINISPLHSYLEKKRRHQ
jgi:4-diphosphocytidyl-2-C-methyl-D-erythritol kinase